MLKHFSYRLVCGMGLLSLTAGAYAADVAQIGSTTYESLSAAIAAATEGSTVTLLADTQIDAMIPVTKTLTLDLAGHTITNNVKANRLFRISGVTFTIEGNGGEVITNASSYGVVDMQSASGAASASAKLIVNGGTFSGATDNGSYFKYRTSGQSMELNDVTATISGVAGKEVNIVNAYEVAVNMTVNGGNYTNELPYAVFTNVDGGGHSESYAKNSTVTLTNVNASSTGGPVIRVDNENTTITNCTLTAGNKNSTSYTNTAIAAANGGKITIKGGTYTGAAYSVYVFNSGATITLDGGVFKGKIQVDEAASAHKDAYLYIKNGTIEGTVSVAANADCEISGGQFSDPAGLTQYCVQGYGMSDTANEDGYYTLMQGEATVVHESGITTYSTLAEAMAAAKEGDVVKLIDNVTVTSAIAVPQTMTLDLNGYTITNNVKANRLFRVADGTFTIEGHGGEVITNASSYGVVDMQSVTGVASSTAKLVLNGGTYTGSTDAGAYFKYRTAGQTMELNDVTASVSADSGSKTAIVNAQNISVNLTMLGGNYTNFQPYSIFTNEVSSGQNPNPTENSVIVLKDVTASSVGGPVVQFAGQSNTVTDCTFTAGSSNTQSWANCAVAAENGAKVTINGGTYSGKYSVYGMDSGSVITIVNGTFNNPIQIDEKDSAHEQNTHLYINNGTFNATIGIANNADCSITGGAFADSTGLDKYIPEGDGFTKTTIDGKEYYLLDSIMTSVTDVELEEEGEAEYFTLQGVKVSGNSLDKGIYVVRQGKKVSKVLVK